MNDLIRRKDVLNLVSEGISTDTYEDMEYTIELIKAIPAAEPKMGRWVEVTNGRGGHECSECHEYAPSYQSGREHLTDYCPNCGVKMKRSER